MELVGAFSKLHKEMQITVCMPVVTIDEFNEKFDKSEIDKSIKEFFNKHDKLEIRNFEYDKYSFEHLENFDIPFLLEYSSAEINEVRYRDEYRQDRADNQPDRIRFRRIYGAGHFRFHT